MQFIAPDHRAYHQQFTTSDRPHILMITNHGIHNWQVVPGLPDTGGQNVFVNQFSDALADFGYKITIVNRGGYPHPVSGEMQRGIDYKNDTQRLLYLEDGKPMFVHKEDMFSQISDLVKALARLMETEGGKIDLIISHYWDAAEIGVRFNREGSEHIPHYWVPHSLGALKKNNVAPERWAELRVDERIQVEKDLMPYLDGVIGTSKLIQVTLEREYGYTGPELFLPPSVDIARFHPRQVSVADPIWGFLANRCGYSEDQVRDVKIITEISRTDSTKRKDVLLKAFAQVQAEYSDCLLVLSIDERQERLAGELHSLIEDLKITPWVAVVGSIWDILPTLYAVSDIYCTPSVMEGFGMSAQEAAATRVPVIASNLVPFVAEYLLGEKTECIIPEEGSSPIILGEGAIVVQADDIGGFDFALKLLLSDNELCSKLGDNAYNATIPYFTWNYMVSKFLDKIGTDFGKLGG